MGLPESIMRKFSPQRKGPGPAGPGDKGFEPGNQLSSFKTDPNVSSALELGWLTLFRAMGTTGTSGRVESGEVWGRPRRVGRTAANCCGGAEMKICPEVRGCGTQKIDWGGAFNCPRDHDETGARFHVERENFDCHHPLLCTLLASLEVVSA